MSAALPRPEPHGGRDRLVRGLRAHGFRPAPAFWNGGVALALFRWRAGSVDKIVVPGIGPCAWLRTELLDVPEEPSWLLGEMSVWRLGRLDAIADEVLDPRWPDGSTS